MENGSKPVRGEGGGEKMSKYMTYLKVENICNECTQTGNRRVKKNSDTVKYLQQDLRSSNC